MKRRHVTTFSLLAATLSVGGLATTAPAEARRPVRGAVAADHVLASRAGADMLRAGGNAVDAAVAAALVSGVVQPSGSGLGGGGFAVVAGPRKVRAALDFRETAPAAATRDMYANGASSQLGGLAVATPAEAFGLVEMETRWGRLGLAKVAAPAIRLAEEGFETGTHLANSLLKSPEMRSALFGEGNRRPGLARALHALVDTRGRAFRDGWVASDLVASVQAAGGILTVADLANYEVVDRTPLVAAWDGGGPALPRGRHWMATSGSGVGPSPSLARRRLSADATSPCSPLEAPAGPTAAACLRNASPRTVLAMPPPSSGGIGVLQLLGTNAQGTHCAVEAAKHVMAERATLGGDVGAADDEAVAARLAPAHLTAIRNDCGPQTFASSHYAPPLAPQREAGTLHISAMDDAGWAVALTTTINTSFGSRVVARESGILLNNEMDDFTTRPGQPNAFGLVQSEANAIAPGKRPLSSMSPTIVLDADGRPEIVAGASGGPFILTGTYQAVAAALGGASAYDAVARPRWHHQWMPDAVFVEPYFPASDRSALEAAGHVLKEQPGFSAVQLVQRRADGTFDAASDPRKHGDAVVVP